MGNLYLGHATALNLLAHPSPRIWNRTDRNGGLILQGLLSNIPCPSRPASRACARVSVLRGIVASTDGYGPNYCPPVPREPLPNHRHCEFSESLND